MRAGASGANKEGLRGPAARARHRRAASHRRGTGDSYNGLSPRVARRPTPPSREQACSLPSADSPRIVWSDPARQQAFERWLGGVVETHGLLANTLVPASADASFRRYFRIRSATASCIVMDAPPPLEDVRPGGLGTHFIRAIMDDASFIPLPDGEGNLLELVKRRRSSGEPGNAAGATNHAPDSKDRI